MRGYGCGRFYASKRVPVCWVKMAYLKSHRKQLVVANRIAFWPVDLNCRRSASSIMQFSVKIQRDNEDFEIHVQSQQYPRPAALPQDAVSAMMNFQSRHPNGFAEMPKFLVISGPLTACL